MPSSESSRDSPPSAPPTPPRAATAFDPTWYGIHIVQRSATSLCLVDAKGRVIAVASSATLLRDVINQLGEPAEDSPLCRAFAALSGQRGSCMCADDWPADRDPQPTGALDHTHGWAGAPVLLPEMG